MGRTLGALVAALALAGCASSHPPPTTANAACVASSDPVGNVAEEIGTEPEWGTRLSAVSVERARLPADVVSRTVRMKAGSILEAEAVRADVARLMALEAVANVRVELDGTRLRYVLEERRPIRSVVFEGARPEPGHWLPLVAGELYDPARVQRMRVDLEADLAARGHLDAKVVTRQRAERDGIDVCVRVTKGARWLVGEVRVEGNQALPTPELLALIDTHDGRANAPGKPFREELLEPDLARIRSHYYDRGFVDVEVGDARLRRDTKMRRIELRIPIREGAQHRVGEIRFPNVPSNLGASYARSLGVGSGEIFSRSRIADGLANLTSTSQREFELSTEVHHDTRRVDLWFVRKERP